MATAPRIRLKYPNALRQTEGCRMYNPEGRAPIVIAAFYNHAEGPIGPHESLLRDVARVVVEKL